MKSIQNDNRMRRNHFKKEEDEMLTNLVEKYGENNWSQIASEMPGRNIRQCRERWQNNLQGKILKNKWTKEEETLLKQKVNEVGTKWKMLENYFPGRTSYNIRNKWTCISRYINKEQKNQEVQVKPKFVLPIIDDKYENKELKQEFPAYKIEPDSFDILEFDDFSNMFESFIPNEF